MFSSSGLGLGGVELLSPLPLLNVEECVEAKLMYWNFSGYGGGGGCGNKRRAKIK